MTAGQSIPLADITAGKLKFTPARRTPTAPRYATFTFQVQDDGGTANGGVDLDPTPNTITVNVTAVNDDPVAVADSKTIPEDAAATAIDVLANDTDVEGGTRTITATTDGTKGTVTFTATGVTYKPNLHVNGADSFTYTISDNQGGTATGTVNVTITPVNHNPLAPNDAGLTVPEGAGATALNVLGNDSDVDGDTLTITSEDHIAAHGTVAITGGGTGLTYKPATRYKGTDTFTLHGQRRPRRDRSGHGRC